MSDWIGVENGLPTEIVDILVLIEAQVFLGEAGYFGDCDSICLDFMIRQNIKFHIGYPDNPHPGSGPRWILPRYMHQPTHWMPMPELPVGLF